MSGKYIPPSVRKTGSIEPKLQTDDQKHVPKYVPSGNFSAKTNHLNIGDFPSLPSHPRGSGTAALNPFTKSFKDVIISELAKPTDTVGPPAFVGTADTATADAATADMENVFPSKPTLAFLPLHRSTPRNKPLLEYDSEDQTWE